MFIKVKKLYFGNETLRRLTLHVSFFHNSTKFYLRQKTVGIENFDYRCHGGRWKNLGIDSGFYSLEDNYIKFRNGCQSNTIYLAKYRQNEKR